MFCKCEELVEKMKIGLAEGMAGKVMMLFIQEIEIDPIKNIEVEEGGHLIAPQEACNKIAEVVQETIQKMEMVAEEKIQMFKKASVDFYACDKELEEDKVREATEIKMDKL